MSIPASISSFTEPALIATVRYRAATQVQKTVTYFGHKKTKLGDLAGSVEASLAVSDGNDEKAQHEPYVIGSVALGDIGRSYALTIGATALAQRKSFGTDGEAESVTSGTGGDISSSIRYTDISGAYADISAAFVKENAGFTAMFGIGVARKHITYMNGTSATGGSAGVIAKVTFEFRIYKSKDQSVFAYSEVDYDQIIGVRGDIGSSNLECRGGLKYVIPTDLTPKNGEPPKDAPEKPEPSTPTADTPGIRKI